MNEATIPARVLVVDDNVKTAELLARELEAEGYRVLLAEPRTAALKVVALTALAMKGDAGRLLAEGFDGYLEKPIRYKEFQASVAALLEGRNE